MRLLKVTVPPHFTTTCKNCGRRVQTDITEIREGLKDRYAPAPLWADLDGKAFEAYYCNECKGVLNDLPA